MTLHVVRHARAGDRGAWEGPDRDRPLSKTGRRQAALLADRLSGELTPAARVLTSPYLRCRQTVEPLVARLDTTVEVVDDLAEGASPDLVTRLLDKLVDTDAVLCTHGDVVHLLLDLLVRAGVPLHGDRAEKGSTWVLRTVDSRVVDGRHVPAPDGHA